MFIVASSAPVSNYILTGQKPYAIHLPLLLVEAWYVTCETTPDTLFSILPAHELHLLCSLIASFSPMSMLAGPVDRHSHYTQFRPAG
jgi:hypothetical protein